MLGSFRGYPQLPSESVLWISRVPVAIHETQYTAEDPPPIKLPVRTMTPPSLTLEEGLMATHLHLPFGADSFAVAPDHVLHTESPQ